MLGRLWNNERCFFPSFFSFQIYDEFSIDFESFRFIFISQPFFFVGLTLLAHFSAATK